MVKFVNLFLLLDHVSQLLRTKHVKLKLICRSAHETENTGFLLTKSKRAICKTFFFSCFVSSRSETQQVDSLINIWVDTFFVLFL